MKKNKIIMALFLITLAIIAIVIIALNNKSLFIVKQKERKEQLTTENNAFISIEDHLKEINDNSISFDNLTLLYENANSNSLTSNGKCEAKLSYTFDNDYSEILMSAVGLCAAGGGSSYSAKEAPALYESGSSCTMNLAEGEYKKINNDLYILKNVKKGDTISISRSYTVTSWWTSCRVELSLYTF